MIRLFEKTTEIRRKIEVAMTEEISREKNFSGRGCEGRVWSVGSVSLSRICGQGCKTSFLAREQRLQTEEGTYGS